MSIINILWLLLTHNVKHFQVNHWLWLCYYLSLIKSCNCWWIRLPKNWAINRKTNIHSCKNWFWKSSYNYYFYDKQVALLCYFGNDKLCIFFVRTSLIITVIFYYYASFIRNCISSILQQICNKETNKQLEKSDSIIIRVQNLQNQQKE